MADNHGCQEGLAESRDTRLSDPIRTSSVPCASISCEQITGCAVRGLHVPLDSLAAGLLAAGLLAAGCWLLAAGCWLLAAADPHLTRRPAMCDGNQATLGDWGCPRPDSIRATATR